MGGIASNCARNTDASNPTPIQNTEKAETNLNENDASIFVICGPSGVGKGTLLKELYKELPNTFKTAVSTTTRKPRNAEINGQHYHFTDCKTFEEMISNNEFIEYAKVHNNYYGTSKKAVENVINSNYLCILEIDRNGAINIRNDKNYGENVKYLFITTHDTNNINEVISTLRKRLNKRNSENEEQINVRMKTAIDELNFMQQWKNENKWDYIVFNDNLNDACQKLKNQFIQWQPKIKQNLNDNDTRTEE